MNPKKDSDNFLQETERLRPAVKKIHTSALRLSQFNVIAAALPVVAFTGAIIARNAIPVSTVLFVTSVASAAMVQAARWQKSKLKDAFKAVWDTADKDTRNLALGYLDKAMNNKIGQTKNIIGQEDFNLAKRHVALQWGTTLIVGTVSLPLAPVMYFTAAQTRELGDAQHVESAARHTLKFYDQIKGPPQL